MATGKSCLYFDQLGQNSKTVIMLELGNVVKNKHKGFSSFVGDSCSFDGKERCSRALYIPSVGVLRRTVSPVLVLACFTPHSVMDLDIRLWGKT
ncbi:hypothetical protein GQ457_15G008830 [Hibiscus cannabinus]